MLSPEASGSQEGRGELQNSAFSGITTPARAAGPCGPLGGEETQTKLPALRVLMS